MSLLDHENSEKKKNNWVHCFPRGITIVTLHLHTLSWYDDPHNRQDKNGKIIKYSMTETSNHYCEEYQKKNQEQPINSKIYFGTKIRTQIINLIKNHYEGKEPEKINLLVYRYESGGNKIYRIFSTEDEQALKKSIGCITKNNFQPLYDLFFKKEKQQKNSPWF